MSPDPGNNMLEYDEKRNYIRMEVDCDITYKIADSETLYQGRCTSISGAGVSFIADQFLTPGKAMEINVIPKNAITPPMTAFIEVIRCTKQDNNNYEIAATIQSIKGK
jgi:c-di-GMP-binding flagellar brake protein YcgR